MKVTHFYHRGEAGDIIYAMMFIQAYGPVRLSVNQYNAHGTFDQFKALKPLIESQGYVRELNQVNECPHDAINLRKCIDEGAHSGMDPNIIRPYFERYFVPFKYEKWLKNIQPIDDTSYAVVNVTERYRDGAHRWGEFLPAGEMRFLGLRSEYDQFIHHLRHTGYQDAAKRVIYTPTADFYEAARHIAGAQAFYGNASACLAIAQGLGLSNIYTEVANGTQHTCHFGSERILNLAKQS